MFHGQRTGVGPRETQGMTREAFGPNLRRMRLQRGVTLDEIAKATKVPPDMWEAFEQNDLSRWPYGIFARAYVREYARLVGADPQLTVDEFCRWFPNGDRRLAPVVRGQAEIVGHQDLQWEDTPPSGGERRAGVRGAIDTRGANAARPAAPWWAALSAACAEMFVRLRRHGGRA